MQRCIIGVAGGPTAKYVGSNICSILPICLQELVAKNSVITVCILGIRGRLAQLGPQCL